MFLKRGDSIDSKSLFYLNNNGKFVWKFRISFINKTCDMII